MTMMEDEETKVRPMVPPSSNHATLIPIKKRRSIFIQSSSPLLEEPCPIMEPNDKKQESTCVSQGSTILNVTAEEGKPESSAISPAADASSALQQYEDASVNQDKLEHQSVQLPLTDGESSFDYSLGATRSESDVTDLCTNRSNWDLNTTMDAWEGSVGDAMSISTDNLHGPVSAFNAQVDKKPLGSPSEMPGVNMSVEQTATEHRHKEVDAAISAPSINTPTHEDSLKLGLQIQLPSNFSQVPPHLIPGIDPNTIFSRVSSAGRSSIVSPLVVKSEPSEEAPGQACLDTGSGDLRSLARKPVKHETVDKWGSEVSSSSTLKLFNSRSLSVKAEPTCEAVLVKLSMNEETSNRLESQGMVLESDSKVKEPLPVHCPMVSESQTISNHLKDGSPGREDNDYEDGEVKDQFVADGPVNATPLGNVSNDEDEPENRESTGNLSDQCADSPCQKKEDIEMQLCSETGTPLDEKSQMSVDLDKHLQELSDVEVDSDTNEPATIAKGTILPPTDENPVIHSDVARLSGEATISNHELAGVPAQNGDAVNDTQKNSSMLPKTESSINSDAVGRDSNTESNRSRIINLSATSNMSSPGKTGSPSDRSMPLHDGRKRLPNVTLEGDKLPLRGRDEISNSDLHRPSRERGRGMFPQNSRSGFLRNRRRVPSDMCDDWESGQDFGSEMHTGPLEFHATRYRYNSGYRNYSASLEDGFVGTGRGGRRFLTDSSRNFHSQHSIRQAHEGREGPATRSPPTVGRIPQNMSTSRCTGMDDSELVGVRYGFAQRERNIGSFGAKGLYRINSKSPVRSRSRSPTQWSPPRRRSPDGFVRHPEMAPRRSPPMYRRERIGSPDRAYFRDEVMVRRQNAPPYISRQLDDMREMNTGRDHNFTRPIMHNRNSSTRVSLRTRRYDMVNSRERTQGEYLRFPMRGAARFHDLSGDENTYERRQLNEKRGPVRHLRPTCGADNNGFTYSSNDGSRSYRFFPQDDSVYHEGGNSRERQLERCPKNEPGDAHKTRKFEDEEGSFRHGVSDEFDDMPRYKRERF